MRNRRIWITDKDYWKNNKHKKSVQSLLEKGILQEHPILGYEFYIRKEYVDKIYMLADSENFELLFQLMTVWLEPQKSD